MARTRRALIATSAVVALAASGGIAWALAGADRGANPPAAQAPATSNGVPEAAPRARSASDLGRSFLADWVDSGRVVRRDQGNDTVSEGQAYGLLIALGLRDETSFDAIWSWTKANLMRSDGLLAWQWRDGAVVDQEPASDADLDVARALVLAGTAFGRPELVAEGNALGIRILDRMTVQTAAGRILLPGMWAATTDPFAYNPSYASPSAFAALSTSSGDPRWAELQSGSARVTEALLAKSELPPDWAQVRADGSVDAMPGPAGTGTDVRYSYDAARLALRYAESCNPADVAIAGRLAGSLTRSDVLPAELDLGGGALGSAVHPLSYGARAATLAAVGDEPGARRSLAQAVAVLDESPTYYGAAWAALAPLLLETDRLGSCPLLAKV